MQPCKQALCLGSTAGEEWLTAALCPALTQCRTALPSLAIAPALAVDARKQRLYNPFVFSQYAITLRPLMLCDSLIFLLSILPLLLHL